MEILKPEPPLLSDEPRSHPLISLIVPIYNEKDFITKKIENIEALDYPKDRLQVIFIDGGSEDGTSEIMAQKYLSYIEMVNSPLKGKINQLNFALPRCKGDITFITDTDGLMSPNSIKEVLKEFERDEQIGAVGIYSYPESDYIIDQYYWLMQNKGRLLESRSFSSSIVIATCYAFRRGIIDKFPPDVIADDIYAGYVVNNMGQKVSYIDRCTVTELRAPRNIRNFLSHKFRKSNAFLRESLRFLYKTAEMRPCWRVIFLTKIAQMLLLPYFLFLYVAIGGALISMKRYDVFLIGSLPLGILLFITSSIFSRIQTAEKKTVYPTRTALNVFLLSNFILLACGLSFIFFRHDSCYKRTDVPQN